MNTQTTAQKLADEIEQMTWLTAVWRSARELRRLEAENALLHERHHFNNGVLKELLVALKLAQMCLGGSDDPTLLPRTCKAIDDAIAKVEGNQ